MHSLNVLDPLEKIDRSLVIEASAGTGKTFSIEHLFVRNLLRGVKVNEILVVTFTKASTKELKERILQQLRSIKMGNYPPYLSGKSLEIEQALREFGISEIDTIHAFAKRMLSTYAFEANLFVDHLYEETPLDEEKIKALQDFLRTDLEGLSYSLAQKKIILAQNPDQFVLQEKSTTRFLTFKELFNQFEKIVHEFPQSGICDALVDLSGQFKKKASLEEIEIFGSALEKALQIPSLETFDELLFCKEAVLDHFLERKKKGIDPTWLKAFQEELSPLFKYAVSEEILKKRFMLDLEPLIKERTFSSGRFGFDEILLSMESAVESKEFAECVRGRYKVVLIDEFQDTDPIQWNIFSKLFLKDWEGVLYLVGDPKQSIYAFRNADIYTYLKACEEIGEKVSLLTNYRSHPHLIAPLNAFFDSKEFIPLPKINSYLPYNQVIAGREEDGDFSDRLEFFFSEDEDEALLDITALVQKKGANGCCVLVKDKNQAKKISSVFTEYQVPHFFLKRQEWENHPAILQLKCFLKAIEHPEDLHRLKALLATMFCGNQSKDLRDAPYPDLIAILKKLGKLFKEQGLFAAFNAFVKTPFPLNIPLISGREELAPLYKLVEMAAGKEDVGIYLDRLYLGLEKEEGDFNPKELNGEGVAISTMHMSKGLEFDHVFALGLSAKNRKYDQIDSHPDNFSFKDVINNLTGSMKAAEIESEMIRQLYVSMTRAKETLYIPIFGDNSIFSHYVSKQFTNFEEWVAKEPFVTSRKEGLLPSDSFSVKKETLTLSKPSSLSYRKRSHLIHSYSSMTAHLNEPIFESKEEIALPRGKEMGVLVHSLLETIPYSKLKSEEEMVQWIQDELKEEFPWISHLGSLFFSLFKQRLPQGFCLRDVLEKSMIRELDFLFISEEGRFTADPLEYITGKMDALFEYRGKYYLIDWKTNWLPSYSIEFLEDFMKRSSYHLQAEIYKKALRLSLEKVEGRSFDEAFGGCIYVFLRGIEHGEGIVIWK